MPHPHEKGPTFAKLEPKLGALSVDDVGPACRQVCQVRDRAEVGDTGSKDPRSRHTHHRHRLVVVLTQSAQLPCPEGEFHRSPRWSAEGETWPSAVVEGTGVLRLTGGPMRRNTVRRGAGCGVVADRAVVATSRSYPNTSSKAATITRRPKRR